VGVDLRDNEGVIPASCDGISNDQFGAAFGIHFCRVDEGQTAVEACLDRGDFLFVKTCVFAHAPGAKPKGRDHFSAG
jgi:hypothetical protein